jgi:hypothetical protein
MLTLDRARVEEIGWKEGLSEEDRIFLHRLKNEIAVAVIEMQLAELRRKV